MENDRMALIDDRLIDVNLKATAVVLIKAANAIAQGYLSVGTVPSVDVIDFANELRRIAEKDLLAHGEPNIPVWMFVSGAPNQREVRRRCL